MKFNLQKIFILTLIILFFGTIIVYGISRALPIALGPRVNITSPKDFEVSDNTFVEVTGTVEQVRSLEINGTSIPFNSKGFFSTRIAIYPPLTFVVVTVKDAYGRSKTQNLHIYTKK
jgi:hypothetical protein